MVIEGVALLQEQRRSGAWIGMGCVGPVDGAISWVRWHWRSLGPQRLPRVFGRTNTISMDIASNTANVAASTARMTRRRATAAVTFSTAIARPSASKAARWHCPSAGAIVETGDGRREEYTLWKIMKGLKGLKATRPRRREAEENDWPSRRLSDWRLAVSDPNRH
jgi:hypothetical protein